MCFPTRRPEDKDLKEEKDQKGEQDVGERDLGGIGQQADAEDVDPRRSPDQAGQEQQGVLFHLHLKNSFLNNVQVGVWKNSHDFVGIFQ